MQLRTSEEMITGELTVEGRLIDASNATLFGRITNEIDESFPVVYKPIAGERPLWDFPEGSLAGREVAAYELSFSNGFDCVPTTVMRNGPFGLGAVQQWIEVLDNVDFITLAQQDTPELRNMALFDAVINNTDRKFGHILFTEDGSLFGCDHGVTFHEEYKLRTVLWQFAGSKLSNDEINKVGGVVDWLDSPKSSIFRSYITEGERFAMIQRVEKLIVQGMPYPSGEWPAVPWPPV